MVASPSPTDLSIPFLSTVTTDTLDEVKLTRPAPIGVSSATMASESPIKNSKDSSSTPILVSIFETLTVTTASESAYLL